MLPLTNNKSLMEPAMCHTDGSFQASQNQKRCGTDLSFIDMERNGSNVWQTFPSYCLQNMTNYLSLESRLVVNYFSN